MRCPRTGCQPSSLRVPRGGRRSHLAGLLAWLAASPALAADEPPAAGIRPERFAGPVPATLSLPLVPPLPLSPHRGRFGRPVAAVVLLHDSLGPDPRGEAYALQLLGAGIAVLELLEAGLAPPVLAEAVRALAADPRIDAARLGVLGFGQGAAGALAGELGVAARAAIYPGCAALAAAAQRPPPDGWDGQPVLLLHGGADQANPPAACIAAAGRLAAAGAVVHRIEYRGASYAWDHPGFGLDHRLLLERPDGGGRVEVRPWPALAAVSAAQVAAFFARELAP
ncbi:MAG: hypothetical protein JWP04_3245 [Belnapia sp.]|nr:hypothetical protein [Belnapia sp.]